MLTVITKYSCKVIISDLLFTLQSFKMLCGKGEKISWSCTS